MLTEDSTAREVQKVASQKATLNSWIRHPVAPVKNAANKLLKVLTIPSAPT